jgi:hypothetical protein
MTKYQYFALLAARRRPTNKVRWMLESIETLYDGRKYIRPVAIETVLKCDFIELLNALSKHKRAVYQLFGAEALDKYGNRNFDAHSQDKIYLEGWVSFFKCFDDDLSKDLVEALEKENAAA